MNSFFKLGLTAYSATIKRLLSVTESPVVPSNNLITLEKMEGLVNH